MKTEETPDDLASWNVLVGKVIGRWDHASLKIGALDASPGRFDAGSKLCLEAGGRRRLIEVLASRRQGKSFICDCGLATTEAAESLAGATVWIHRSMRPKLPAGEFYLDEVLGLRVVTESGRELGEIEEVLETPAHNVYVTPRAMIPAHPDFIARTDWDTRVLIVREIAGLEVSETK